MTTRQLGLTIVAVAALLAGCSSGGGKGAGQPSTRTASTAAATSASAAEDSVQCSALLGKPASVWVPVVAAGGPGCMQGTETEASLTFRCKDGSTLYDFGSSPVYFGLSTGTLSSTPGPISQSSGPYAALYQRCTG